MDYPLDNEVIITEVKKIVSFRIENIYIKEFKSALISVSLIEEGTGKITNWSYELKDEEYANWGDDDTYLIDLCKDKISQLH